MTLLSGQAPGVAASSSEVYTQSNTKLAGQAPTRTSYGTTFNDLAENSLVGRVTITGALVLSVPTASDGSQNPIGVTTAAVTNDDSNSAVDSNSTLAGEGARVGFYVDGVFNYDALVKDSGWSLKTLRENLDGRGMGFSVDVIKTASPGTPSE